MDERAGEDPMADFITPGEVLYEEFMVPLGLTKYALAKALHVPAQRIGDIVAGKRAISPDTALRLARAFGTTAEFWLNLQAHYDLERALAAHAAEFDEIRPLVAV
ncbi:HigA family addiction module antitoxin [Leifsonia sp. 22587]|uniref:HigA family addiction module antitoxin n=1 Tax=Leifsonia sp. 22587 TaxID=3453946 RepID=UPI003F82AABD